MIQKNSLVRAIIGVVSLGLTTVAMAHAPSGAIFTTVADGSEVNFNHYPSKQAVYLDGGIDAAMRQQASDGRGVKRAHRDGGRIAQLIEQR